MSATARTTGPGILVLRIGGLLLTLALAALGATLTVGRFFAQTSEQTRTLGPGVTRVIAEVDTGDIRVRTGPAGSGVQVTTTRRWSWRTPVVSATVSAGVAHVTGDCSGVISLQGCSVDLALVVPPGTAVEVSIGTGDATVQDVDAVLRLTVSTGDVTGTGLRSPDVQAAASTGDVSLAFLGPPRQVTARSSTGDVSVAVPPGTPYRVTGSTEVGSRWVQVATDPSAANAIEASTMVGDVQVSAR